jgi:hypothetical protein
MSLPADSPVSRIMAPGGGGAPVLEARIRHFAAEPVTLRLGVRAPVASYTKHVVEDFVAPVTEAANIDCGVEPCHRDAPLDPPDVVSSGTLGGARWSGRLLDADTRQPVPCTAVGCPLPPRTGPEPREYIYVVSLEHAAELGPEPAGDLGEFSLLGLTFTGLDPAASGTFEQCLETHLVGERELCIRRRTFRRLVALDRLQLQVQPIAIDVAAPLDASRIGEPAAYLPGGAVSSGGLTWDSGDDDLPGPH